MFLQGCTYDVSVPLGFVVTRDLAGEAVGGFSCMLGQFGIWGVIWGFPKIGVFPPKWMVNIMENPIKTDDLGVPLFSETSIWTLDVHDR